MSSNNSESRAWLTSLCADLWNLSSPNEAVNRTQFIDLRYHHIAINEGDKFGQVRILITGAGGYIGSHLLQALRQESLDLLAVVGKSIRSHERLSFLNIQGVKLDTRDFRQVQGALEDFKPNVVIHLAGLKSPEHSNREPKLYLENNLESLKNIYEASLKVGVSLLINASSSSIYGDIDSESILENQIGKPISAYGESKKLGEKFLSENYDSRLQVVSLRLFNVIGSGHALLKDSASFHLVPATINRIKGHESPVIYGKCFPTLDGTSIRDYVHVLDVVELFQLVIEKHFQEQDSHRKLIHSVFNVGSGVGTSVLQLITHIGEILGQEVKPIYLSPRDGDPAIVVSNIELVENTFGFTPKRSLDEMLRSCV